MRLIILVCEVMYREISYCVAKSRNIVDVRLLQKGLHDIGQEEMSKTLQAEINQVPKDKYEAIFRILLSPVFFYPYLEVF